MKKVEFDNALNEAGWALVDELRKYGEVGGCIFNNIKPSIAVSIGVYLSEKEKEVPTERPEDKPLDAIEQVDWEVWHGESWYPCIRLGKDIYGNHAYQISEGEFKGEFNGTPAEDDFRKPETPEQRKEREELDRMVSIYEPLIKNGHSIHEGMKALLDAGYRKGE